MARAIKLIDAPIGLFEVDGILVLKTEYSTRHEDGTITPDCYIIESGEYFWGGVDSVLERNNLEVAPVDIPTITPQNEWVSVEERMPDFDVPVLVYVKDLFDNKGTISITKYTITYDLTNNWLGYENSSFKITHWMPLPAPPDRCPTEVEEDA